LGLIQAGQQVSSGVGKYERIVLWLFCECDLYHHRKPTDNKVAANSWWWRYRL